MKGEMTAQPFDIIRQSDILGVDDWKSLEPLKDELKDTFEKVQMFRTPTEMRVSVLNDIKHPTPAAKYWQSVREQNVMFQELVSLSYEYRKNLNAIERLKHQIAEGRDKDGEVDGFDVIDKSIEIERLTFILKNQERTAQARIAEIKQWSKIKAELAAKMSGEELADVDNHQLISYAHRFIRQKLSAGDSGSPAERQNLDGLLHTTLKDVSDRGLLDGVASQYPKEVRERITGEMKLIE